MYKVIGSLLFLVPLINFDVQAGTVINKFVGDRCLTADSEVGACTVLLECEVLVNKLKATSNYDHLVHCNFIGSSPVVCCPGKTPTSRIRGPSSTSSPTEVIFDDGDEYEDEPPKVTTTTTTTTVITPDILTTRDGSSKAEMACAQWRTNASPLLAPQIFKGIPAFSGEFPHMAGLGYKSAEIGKEYDFNCGGSLISVDFVMTAAHCVNRPNSRPIIVRLGKTIINTTEDHSDPVDIGISEFILHHLYNSSLQYHDIALIRLNQSISLSDVVRPACLHRDSKDIPTDIELYATGWGTTELARQSSILLKVNLSYLSLEGCNDRFSYLSPNSVRRLPMGIQDSQLCALDLQGTGKDICGGDSGGPLQMLGNNQVSTVVGVVSVGLVCGSSIPSVYVRVSYYLEWIEKIVWP